MQITGKIRQIGNTETFGSNGFRKREIVVTTEEQYPQHILIEFIQDKCDLLNNFSVGQDVKISINIRGREWTNPQGDVKYFNSLHGWRIEGAQSQKPAAVPPADTTIEDEQDDLPF
jgi:hypothetical protein